MILISIV